MIHDTVHDAWFGNSFKSNIITRTPLTFQQLFHLCIDPKRSAISVQTYKNLSDDQQKLVKNNRNIMPASYKSGTNKTTRKTENIRWIEFIIIDIDNSDDAFRVKDPLLLESVFEDRDINYLIYSTFRSTPTSPRFRLIVPAHRLPKEEYRAAVATICYWLQIVPNSESMNMNQLHYLPHMPQDGEYEVVSYIEGRSYLPTDFDPGATPLLEARGHGKGRDGHGNLSPQGEDHDGEHDKDSVTDFENWEPPVSVEEHQYIEALNHIDPRKPYPEWRKVACAIKHYFQSDPDRGLEEFDRWSAMGDCELYKGFEDCKKLWDNIDPNKKGGVTSKHVLQLARDESGWSSVTPLVKVNGGDKQDEVDAELDLLTKPVYPDYIEKMLEKWALLKRDNLYIDLSNPYSAPIRRTIFNTIHMSRSFSQADITKNGTVSKMSPYPKIKPDMWFSLYEGKLYESTMYGPGKKKTFMHDGAEYVNTWKRPQYKPYRDEHTYTILDDHFRWLIRDDLKRQTYLTILQHLVKNPGSRLSFCTVLQGGQGIGKSFIAKFMEVLLGTENVQQLSTRSLSDNLTEWAGRSEASFIEEIYMPGKKRYEVIEGFKPYISNASISIRESYKGTKTVINPTSYLAFTNHRDAIPVDSMHDRRYYVIFSSVQRKVQVTEQNERYGGCNAFFNKLWPLLNDPGACAHWLLSQPPLAGFDPTVTPEITDDMHYMHRMTKSPIEEAVDELLEQRPRGIYTHVISSTVILALLEVEGFPISTTRVPVSKMLQKNWIKCDKRIKLKGDKHTLWHDGTIGNNHDATELWKKYFTGVEEEGESNIIPFKPED